MIERHLKQYLTHIGPVAGHAAEMFAETQVIEGRKLFSRNDARRHLQDLIGDRVYLGRIPQTVKAHTAVTIDLISGGNTLALKGETGMRWSVMEIAAKSRAEGQSDYIAAMAARLIEIAIVNYYGPMGDSYIHGCDVERPATRIQRGMAADDRWPVKWSMDVTLYFGAAAAVYPVSSLTARIQTRASQPGSIVFDASASSVPEGATIDDVQWIVRDAPGGSVLRQWSGASSKAASGANLGGTNLQTTASELETGWADLQITDSNGSVSTAGAEFSALTPDALIWQDGSPWRWQDGSYATRLG